MLESPSRVSALIQRLEAGEVPTPQEFRNIASLQALDIAKLGEDFVHQRMADEDAITQQYKALAEN